MFRTYSQKLHMDTSDIRGIYNWHDMNESYVIQTFMYPSGGEMFQTFRLRRKPAISDSHLHLLSTYQD